MEIKAGNLEVLDTLEQYLDGDRDDPDLTGEGDDARVLKIKYDKLSEAIVDCLEGEAATFITSNRCRTAHDAMKVLNANYGDDNEVDQEQLHNEFTG